MRKSTLNDKNRVCLFKKNNDTLHSVCHLSKNVGSAIVFVDTRGEFSFFIAQEASDEGILTTEDYSAVVWALLLSSVAAPLFFRKALAKQDNVTNNIDVDGDDDGSRDRSRIGGNGGPCQDVDDEVR